MGLRPRHGLSLCAGGGGLDLGLMLAEPGYHTRAFVEWEDWPRAVLIAAQRAGYFAPAPIWTDLTTFDGRPFQGAIDTILAGYPCQPFSMAGQRRGEDDERHLWPHVARVIREIGPRWVFLENVAGHLSLGGEAVLRELWDMGFTPAAGIFSASETGAPHERQRLFIVAHCDSHQRRADGPEPAAGADRRDDVGGRGGNALADADGGHCGAEREQRGGQLGFQPEGRGSGEGTVGHASGIGRRQGRAEPIIRGGRDTATGAGRELADASKQGPQGREQRGASDERDRPPAHGPASERRCLPLYPPGPGDADAWSAVIRSAPDLAPSAAARDLHAWARRLEADGRERWEAQAEPEFRRMVDGLAHRAQPLRLLGNAVVPLQAAMAWVTLSRAHGLGGIEWESARNAEQ